jgi:toxin ParE1/3/4
LAAQDVAEALDHYLIAANTQAALGFVAALEASYAHVSQYPATGSPRYAHALNLPGLRFWPLTAHPYLVFYLEQPDRIDVWRVLHGKRDLPVSLQEETDF